MLRKTLLSFLLCILVGCASFGVQSNTPPPNGSVEIKVDPHEVSPEVLAKAREQRQLLMKMIELSATLCQEAYPPLSLNDCFERIYTGMMSQGDVHTEYMNNKAFKDFVDSNNNQYAGIGVTIDTRLGPSGAPVVGVSPGGAAEKVGLRVGDTITRVNGKPHVEFADVSALIKVIRGEPGTSVTLGIVRAGEKAEREYRLVRQVVKIEQVRSELIKDGEKVYGLLLTAHFGRDFAKDVRSHYEQLVSKNAKPLDGLIISVEGNPGGILPEAADAIDLFTEYSAPSPILVRTASGIEVYGTEPHEAITLHHTPGDITNGIPIVVVVDGNSASASEIFAGGMKLMHRATISGTSSTFEKGVIQTVRPLSDGSAVKFTSGEYLVGFTDDWVAVQCFGVAPDILLPPWTPVSPLDAKGPASQRLTECRTERSAASGGQMKDAPKRMTMQEANSTHFKAGEAMTAAYVLWRKAKIAEASKK